MHCDYSDQTINLKAFHCKIINDHDAMKNENKFFQTILEVRKVDYVVSPRNYQQIKQEVRDIIESGMEKILNDPDKENMVVKK